VDVEEQLSWEQRVGRPVAIAAFASAALFLAALIYQSVAIPTLYRDAGSGEQLLHFYDHKGDVLIGTILQALSTALVAVPLWFLYEATRFRRPETPRVARYVALIGGPLVGILVFVRHFAVVGAAEKLRDEMATRPLSPPAADQFADDRLADSLQLVEVFRFAAGLALAFAFVLVSLNAMRAGLLSRFMGVLGIIVGVLFVLPLLGTIPVVQTFWIAALGLLFLGRWPQGGRGPAWDTGEPDPWPTAQERQAALMEAREGGADGADEDDRPPETIVAGRRPAPDTEPDAGDHTNGARQHTQHPRSKKRKRKRR
jgi:hypothetical protein